MKNDNPILTEEQIELVKNIAQSTIMAHQCLWDEFCEKLDLHAKSEPQIYIENYVMWDGYRQDAKYNSSPKVMVVKNIINSCGIPIYNIIHPYGKDNGFLVTAKHIRLATKEEIIALDNIDDWKEGKDFWWDGINGDGRKIRNPQRVTSEGIKDEFVKISFPLVKPVEYVKTITVEYAHVKKESLSILDKPKQRKLKYLEGSCLHWSGMVGNRSKSDKERPGSVTVVENADKPKHINFVNTHYLIRDMNGNYHCVVEDSLSPIDEPSFKNGDHVCEKSDKKHIVYEITDSDYLFLRNVVTNEVIVTMSNVDFRLAEDKDWYTENGGAELKAEYVDNVLELKYNFGGKWKPVYSESGPEVHNRLMKIFCDALQVPIQKEPGR